MDVWEIYIDGACKGNPGEASAACVFYKNGEKVKESAKTIGLATNNIAEYSAMIYALQEARLLNVSFVKVFTDSELLFKQVTGDYQVKNLELQKLCSQVQQLAKGFEKIEIRHIPREKNHEADKLASQVIKDKQAKVVASSS